MTWATRVASKNLQNISYEIFLACPINLVQYWLVWSRKTLLIFFPVRPKSRREKKKEKKKRRGNCKAFCVTHKCNTRSPNWILNWWVSTRINEIWRLYWGGLFLWNHCWHDHLCLAKNDCSRVSDKRRQALTWQFAICSFCIAILW